MPPSTTQRHRTPKIPHENQFFFTHKTLHLDRIKSTKYKQKKDALQHLQRISWRSEADSNRCKWFCRPVPNPSAIRPYLQKHRTLSSHLSECKDTYFLINSKFYAMFFRFLSSTPLHFTANSPSQCPLPQFCHTAHRLRV